ncbi:MULTISPECIES: hypothetical protein [unclassified Pseudomonas]|uniref:hypothetical protein n=1 Tax=unclassified Pseudomonas TaxID=196821 RepID=UPI002113EA98|nr:MULTISPECIES: hypothetical protein [unclassified Pseudomonas]
MSMELLTLSIKGTSPLMMHSDKLANPLHPATKAHRELTSKRKKVDDDHVAIAKSEFVAGVYLDERSGIHVPGANFDATFLAGAKLQKLGTHWKRGALVMTDRATLEFDGPSTPEALWEDPRFVDCRGVKVGQAKIMRYRPIFLDWACQLDDSICCAERPRSAAAGNQLRCGHVHAARPGCPPPAGG